MGRARAFRRYGLCSRSGVQESYPLPNSKTYGEFHNVNLSDEEYQRLKEKLKSHTNTMIEKLSRYMQSSGKTYQDHYATLLHWYEKDEEELRKKTNDRSRAPTIEEYMIDNMLCQPVCNDEDLTTSR